MVHGFARLESLTITRQKAVDISAVPATLVIGLNEEVPIARAELILSEGLEVEHNGCMQKTYVADLVVSFKNLNEPRAFIEASIDNAYKNKEGVVSKFDCSATIFVDLPAAEFPSFMERQKNGLTASFSFYSERSLATLADYHWVKSEINDLQICYHVGTSKNPTWYADSLEKQATIFLVKLAASSYSQVQKITSELSQSAAKFDKPLRHNGKDISKIAEIISDLKAALRKREPEPADDTGYSKFWFHSVDEFQRKISHLNVARQKELMQQFDTVWGTFDLVSVISGGEDGHSASQSGFDPKPEELESVATQMLALRPLRSPTLESILVNALIYAETIEFARNVLSKEKIFGIRVPSKVRKKEQSELKTLGYLLWGFFLEVIKIGLTVLASFAITNENVIAAWVVATGFTLFRWWNNTFAAAQKDSNKEQRLLLEMCAAHQMSNKYNYNARLLRQTLYEVCSQGAVFSPMIFTILDMQIQEGIHNDRA